MYLDLRRQLLKEEGEQFSTIASTLNVGSLGPAHEENKAARPAGR